jgi:integrating conjugative element protein (TIGR03761 family)
MAGKKKLAFQTDPNSPFPDKYSVEKEEIALKEIFDLWDADGDIGGHPLFPRFAEWEIRMKQVKFMKSEDRDRLGAEKAVSYLDAQKPKRLTRFVRSSSEKMTLHTRDAFYLFMGRTKTNNPNGHTTVGGARAAAVCKMIWYLSQNDNPYADWALVSVADALTAINASLETQIASIESNMDKLRQRGLDYHVVVAQEPQEVELTFVSPYGFMIAESLTTYDYFVRCVRTLERHDRLTTAEARAQVYEPKRQLRGLFEMPIRFQRVLLTEKMQALSRADFKADANADAKERVKLAADAYGAVPMDVFTGDKLPRHTKRNLNVSLEHQAELKMLAQQVAVLTTIPADAVVDMNQEKGLI